MLISRPSFSLKTALTAVYGSSDLYSYNGIAFSGERHAIAVVRGMFPLGRIVAPILEQIAAYYG